MVNILHFMKINCKQKIQSFIKKLIQYYEHYMKAMQDIKNLYVIFVNRNNVEIR